MSDLILLGASRKITLTFKVKDDPSVQEFVLWPDRINRVPRVIFELCRANKGSPKNGAPGRSPVDCYLDEGMIWEMTAKEAQRLFESKAPIVSPAGEAPGVPDVSPEPRDVPRSEAMRKLEASILASDPHAKSMEIKPPPAPVAP